MMIFRALFENIKILQEITFFVLYQNFQVQKEEFFQNSAGTLTGRKAQRAQIRNNRPINDLSDPSGSSASALSSSTSSSLDGEDGVSSFTAKVGFRVRNSHANGVIVYSINPGEAAERAGLHVSDIVIYANNRPTRNLTEFRSVVNNTSGPIYLQVLRRGTKKLLITIHR